MNTIHTLFDKSGLLWQLETGKIIYVPTVKKINNNNNEIKALRSEFGNARIGMLNLSIKYLDYIYLIYEL